MKFKGILRERTTGMKIALVLAAGFMMFLSITGKMYTYAAIAAVAILAVFFQKEHIVSKEGVDIRYNLFGWVNLNRWEWEDISAVKTDYMKKAPDVLVHFNKDVTIRDFVMKRADVPGVLALAREMNPDIFIADLNEEERERCGQERLHQQEVERGRNAAKKRKK